MLNDRQYVENVCAGLVKLPTTSTYSFFMEVEKVIKKALVDNRFTYVKNFIVLNSVDDGMYVNEDFLYFKLGSDAVFIHRDNDGQSLNRMQGWGNVKRVLDHYFNPVENDGNLNRYRLMKSYFHYFENSKGANEIHRSTFELTLDEYNEIISLFKTSGVLEVKDFYVYSKWLAENESERFVQVVSFNNVYTLYAHLDRYNGLNIIIGTVDDQYVADCYFGDTENSISFSEVYKELTQTELPYELKQIIAFCFKRICVPLIQN